MVAYNLNPFIESAQVPNLLQAIVDYLVSADSKSWKSDFIMANFNERDSTLIHSIPLSRSDCQDSWTWAYEKKGVYSVRNGYLLLQLNAPIYIMPPATNWKSIWGLSVAPKIKNLRWKSLLNCVPTLFNLRSRDISVEELCPSCTT